MTSFALASCGILVDVGSADPTIPDRADGGADGAREGATTDESSIDGALVDAKSDACAPPAACAPELITTLGASVARLVADGSSLYAGVIGASHRVLRVQKVPPGAALDLDPQAGLADQFRADANIVVDSTGAVYWGTPNGMRRHEPTAGADASTDAGVTALADLGAPVAGVRIFGGRLHFAVQGPNGGAGANSGHIGSCALPGCSDVQSPVYAPMMTDFMMINGAPWWFGTDSTFQNFGLRGTGNILVGGEQKQPSRMVGDGKHVYWSAMDGLRMFTPAVGAIEELVSTVTSPRFNGIALDTDGTLYVTQGSAVLRCSVTASACAPTPFATSASTVLDVALDDTYAYWGTTDGSIFRQQKR